MLQERWTRENGVCVTRKMDEREWCLCYKKDRRVIMKDGRENGVCVTRKMDE